MLAKLFAGPLAILYWGIGLWGFVLTAQYVYSQLGTIGVIVCILLGPVTFFIAPLWAGIADDIWLPAMVSYAPMVVMMAVSLVGSAFER